MHAQNTSIRRPPATDAAVRLLRAERADASAMAVGYGVR